MVLARAVHDVQACRALAAETRSVKSKWSWRRWEATVAVTWSVTSIYVELVAVGSPSAVECGGNLERYINLRGAGGGGEPPLADFELALAV